jgi:multimeric flavodoxin WrbA
VGNEAEPIDRWESYGRPLVLRFRIYHKPETDSGSGAGLHEWWRKKILNTLLGLIASPRRMGNSELMVKEIYRQLPRGWALNLLRIPEFSVKPCLGCYQCLFREGRCGQKDDFPIVLEALTQADAYVAAAPTYLFGAHASLKALLDRGLTFNGYVDALWGKPAVGVVLAGLRGMEGYAKLMVDSFIKFSLADHRGSEIVYAALPGEVFLSHEAKRAAQRLAKALIGETPEHKDDSPVPRCNLCGGDTFRFLPNGNVRCMVCSSEGSYGFHGNALRIETVRGDHAVFLTREDTTNHFEFLRGMKDRFVAKRKDLKAAVQEYHDVGEWIRPPSK